MSQLSPGKLSSALVSEAATCPRGVAAVTWFPCHPPTGERGGCAQPAAGGGCPVGGPALLPRCTPRSGEPGVPCRGRLAPWFWAVHTQPSQLTSWVLSVPAPRPPREASSCGLPSTTKMASLRSPVGSPPLAWRASPPTSILAHGERPRAWRGGREGSREGLRPELKSPGRGWGDSGSKGSRAGRWGSGHASHQGPPSGPRVPGFQERSRVLTCVSQAQPTGT